MIPWAPEPVMLMAGLSNPMTRASMAPLQMSAAVFTTSSEKTFPPFMARSTRAKVVRGLSNPSWNKAIFMVKASRMKEISSRGTVRAYSASWDRVYRWMTGTCSLPSSFWSSAVLSSTARPSSVTFTMLVWASRIRQEALWLPAVTRASMEIRLVISLMWTAIFPAFTIASAAFTSSSVIPSRHKSPFFGSAAKAPRAAA